VGKQGANKVGMTRHHMRQSASCLGVVQGARYSRGLFAGCKSLERLMWAKHLDWELLWLDCRMWPWGCGRQDLGLSEKFALKLSPRLKQ